MVLVPVSLVKQIADRAGRRNRWGHVGRDCWRGSAARLATLSMPWHVVCREGGGLAACHCMTWHVVCREGDQHMSLHLK
jgi:hypothetical protein